MAAYDGLYETAHNLIFLYLTVPPNTIDINIHPTKTEIKFDDEHALYAILRASIKHSLGSLTQSLDFDRDANLDTPYHYKDLRFTPTIQVDGSFNFLMIKLISIIQVLVQNLDRKLGKLIRGLKQEGDFISGILSFESEEVTGSLFNEEEVEQTLIMLIK
jgi:DNA mismatch repair protein MutL